jgi:putative membrane-bound dehydrogenase-like protein
MAANRRCGGCVIGVVTILAWMMQSDLLAQTNSREQAGNTFLAGAAAIDISPTTPTSIIAGGFLEGRATKVTDPLYVRSIVLDDQKTKIALVVVDTCMMTQELIDEAKTIASKKCGIAVDHMMVSATHTHSAPAAMGCLGTRQDKAYAAMLPGKIAESIRAADAKRQPAKIGWASIDDWEHTHNRRWIRKPERKVEDPFGEATGRANMHPGHLSADVIGPSGPVDPGLSVISVQTKEGTPLAVLANYSQHYYGSEAVSADYYGRFSKYIAKLLKQPGEGNGPFVCTMSQGTSGDLMWMDYGSAAKSPGLERYAEAVALYAEKALKEVVYHDYVPLAIVEKRLTLGYRTPSEARLAWARPIAAKIENDLPKSLPEVYAREAIILHERQKTEIKLQAIRIGDLTISTLPNEVYALTGLKLKGRSPFAAHFNIELANGAEGYIPPPEQHVLGGYTTWPARTAGLEVEAETKIVDTLVGALEEATGKKRRAMDDEHGAYATTILNAKPTHYWRLNDADGKVARNAVDPSKPLKLKEGYAWYLPGVASGTGTGKGEALKTSAFSGAKQINRAVHLAGGQLDSGITSLDKSWSIVLWFWLGEKSGASERSGTLIELPNGTVVKAKQSADHTVELWLDDQVLLVDRGVSWRGAADQWHQAVLNSNGEAIELLIDETQDDTLQVPMRPAIPGKTLTFGAGLEGKLDEIAVFDRGLSSSREVKPLWELSGVAQQVAQAETERKKLAEEYAARIKPPKFPEDYGDKIDSLKPIVHFELAQRPAVKGISGGVEFAPGTFAKFGGGRIDGQLDRSLDTYSVSMWFRCETSPETQPVAGYFFSRGPSGNAQAPGDHLGIGGNYRAEHLGKLLFFNGNERDQVAAGATDLPPGTWNHVVLVRDGKRVRAYLNGETKPEFDAEIEPTAKGVKDFYLGARSDQFAPLQGNLAQFALFDRALSADEAKQLHAASGQSVGTPKPAPIPPQSEPVSAKESLKLIHVPKGYRAELVASEPQVLDPVAFDWDAQGRLWVVEMADYPLGMDGKGKPGGRVRVLEDADGDGRYEKGQLFAEGLNFPNGILTWRDGVIVTAAPEILFLRDTDNDGKMDSREVLLAGFNEGNQQLRVNGLRWGLDNWVYCANGGHHAAHGLGIKVQSTRSGNTYEIGSRDFRFRPDTGELELESGPSQFGRNRDAWGHWFGTQNANPLWHYVIADRYLARNPYVPMPPAIRHVVGPGSPPVFPASEREKRYHGFEQIGRFTSACGSTIYGDEQLFEKSDSQHAFSCEPFSNLVQHNIISDAGVSFVSSRAAGEEKYDFFASEDRWCRPVMARTGPDGAIWIADMYRYMIEHPDWLPKEGKEELLPHYRLGEDRGRIYRVVRDGVRSDAPVALKLDQLDTAGLVAALDSPNDWRRDKVQQLLLWKNDPKAVPLLLKLFQVSLRPRTRVQAIYVLDGLGALTAPNLIAALADAHPGVRENAIRLAESRDDETLIAAATKLASDADAKVRLQLALSCGEWKSEKAAAALAEIAARDAEESLMVAAVMSSALPHSKSFVPAVLKADPKVAGVFNEPLLRQALGSHDAAATALMLSAVFADLDNAELCSQRLGDFLVALERVNSSLEKLKAEGKHGSINPLVQRAETFIIVSRLLASDENSPWPLRISAAKLLCRCAPHREYGASVLAQQLLPQTDAALQSSIITWMSQSGAKNVPELMIAAWPTLSPALKTEVLDALLSRRPWTEQLLTQMEAKEISRNSLDLTQQARLTSHPVEAISQRAKVVFETASASTRKKVLEDYQVALKLAGDPKFGRAVFEKTCATCHRRGDLGKNIGPNLATVISHAPEKLLTNILDPNVDIQPGYQTYACVLGSGEVLSGLLSGETASSITIAQANGVVRTVVRSEIEELRNLNTSLMPEGLETSIPPQEMANLLAYLKQPIEPSK